MNTIDLICRNFKADYEKIGTEGTKRGLKNFEIEALQEKFLGAMIFSLLKGSGMPKPRQVQLLEELQVKVYQ